LRVHRSKFSVEAELVEFVERRAKELGDPVTVR